MDPASLVIEILKQKQTITPLEQDILDTWNELCKHPFDMNSAYQQVIKNDVNHSDICSQIASLPTTTVKPLAAITEDDLRYNLNHQFELLIEKERRVPGNGQ